MLIIESPPQLHLKESTISILEALTTRSNEEITLIKTKNNQTPQSKQDYPSD